jgi:predicted ATPase
MKCHLLTFLQTQQVILKLASAQGPEFRVEILLTQLSSTSKLQLFEILAQLEKMDIVNQKLNGKSDTVRNRGLYSFTQNSFQEVVYQQMLLAKRQELHGQIAAYYESHKELIDGRSYSVLVYHWKLSNSPHRAIHYFSLAGKHAMEVQRYLFCIYGFYNHLGKR